MMGEGGNRPDPQDQACNKSILFPHQPAHRRSSRLPEVAMGSFEKSVDP